ncbi:flagellar protein export ATPase FliI [Neptunomonas phycophila]|uniref:Flagellum-specific ATP synthase n=1 Tax=Neptunomonas phycophila TaxID=1572645 RepID=A0AAW7XLV3_9GAMM|nr:flagellar protein export ATPase FliI [Neptunomonas phycophila]MDO6455241.1 flagellar protein export ATPase FliI [Neptunomonas phycophila]
MGPSNFTAGLEGILSTPLAQPAPRLEGRITRLIGLTIEAVGLRVAIGDNCLILVSNSQKIEAEVVGFNDEKIYLMPLQPVEGLSAGAKVIPMTASRNVPVGFELLGRVLNGVGEPIDSKGPLGCALSVSMAGETINPLDRHPIDETLDVGIKAINALLTVGKGQRLGLFAGSGVGKSVLLGMMTRATSADITVVGLIGERGREVKEFIEHNLGEQGLARSVVVASPADDSPLMRLRASQLTTRIAEYFRSQGKSVLLLVDSLTRYAQAQREIALAIGEPPATKGYPPSVFAKLPKLVERAGNDATGKGSITAFYTVLTEGDDQQDPIADSARAILDGHVVLSRQLAEQGHYPAIDIEASISRAMPAIVEAAHLKAAMRFKQLYSKYQQNTDLIAVGAYVRGSDPDTDFAIEKMPTIRQFLQQGLHESVNVEQSLQMLAMSLQPNEPPARPAVKK